MKILRLALLTSSLILAIGCVHPVAAPANLPAGAVDWTDANANEALYPIHQFLLRWDTDIAAGKVQLTPSQLDGLNIANKAVNVADLAEKAYHNAGGGDAAILNAAVAASEAAYNTIQASLAAAAK